VSTHFLHFRLCSTDELRDPSREFDTRYYLGRYPDVTRSCLNPQLHYACVRYTYTLTLAGRWIMSGMARKVAVFTAVPMRSRSPVGSASSSTGLLRALLPPRAPFHRSEPHRPFFWSCLRQLVCFRIGRLLLEKYHPCQHNAAPTGTSGKSGSRDACFVVHLQQHGRLIGLHLGRFQQILLCGRYRWRSQDRPARRVLLLFHIGMGWWLGKSAVKAAPPSAFL
jgi:hypothetical protein